MQVNINQTLEILKSCRDAYILIHQSPDGDAIGSGFALFHFFRLLGIRSKVVCCDKIPTRYSFITDGYTDEDFQPKSIVSTDLADPKLLGDLYPTFKDSVDLCIDHHISNIMYAKNTYVIPEASSACAVLFDIFKISGIPLTDRIAACLYTGLATDTGCFKFENTGADAHRIAYELISGYNFDFAKINHLMFDVKSKARMSIEKEALSSMEFFLDDKLAVITIPLDSMERLGVRKGDMEGIASLPLQAETVEVGVTIRQKEKELFRISVRSASKTDVSAICGKFGGGGHIRAAGCTLSGSLDTIKKSIIDEVEKALNLKC